MKKLLLILTLILFITSSSVSNSKAHDCMQIQTGCLTTSEQYVISCIENGGLGEACIDEGFQIYCNCMTAFGCDQMVPACN